MHKTKPATKSSHDLGATPSLYDDPVVQKLEEQINRSRTSRQDRAAMLQKMRRELDNERP